MQNSHPCSFEALFDEFKLSRVDILKIDCQETGYDPFYNSPSSIFKNIHSIVLKTPAGNNILESNTALSILFKGLGFKVKTKGDNWLWAYRKPRKGDGRKKDRGL